MTTFRKIVFWAHLISGLLAGLAIGIMCFTGTALAFEKQLIAFAERDARKIAEPAPGAARLTLTEIQTKLRAAHPTARPATLVIQNDPRAAVAFPAGRAPGYYVNPYTGDVRQPESAAMGSFMQTMVTWHRYLGFTGDVSRPRGKLVNGICNLVFAVLAMSGLYLWMPRTWSLRGVKAVALFNWRLVGKPRDFNWHNSIGLWSAPILIVLTLTAVPISFQWGGRVINWATGTPQPAPAAAATGGRPAPAAQPSVPAIAVPTPPPGAVLLSQDALVARVQREIPQWQTITIGIVRGDANPARATAVAAPITFTVRANDSWPRTANTTLALDPYTGDVLRRTGYAQQTAPQRVRAWTRFLHTGEALGWVGQGIAGVASLGGCFLVYTGFALSWRRFFGKNAKQPDVT